MTVGIKNLFIARVLALLVVATLVVKPCMGLLTDPVHAAERGGSGTLIQSSDRGPCKNRCLFAHLDHRGQLWTLPDARRASDGDLLYPITDFNALALIPADIGSGPTRPANRQVGVRARLALLSRLLH